MHHSRNSTLSISLNRSRFAFAVFQSGELIYYGGKTLRKFHAEKDLCYGVKLIIRKLIKRYDVTTVLLPELNKQQLRSATLRKTYRTINHLLAHEKLIVRRYDSVSARSFICKTGKPTKATAAKTLAEQFPDLGKYLIGNTDWERRYYGHVFSAIAGGVFYGK